MGLRMEPMFLGSSAAEEPNTHRGVAGARGGKACGKLNGNEH